MIERYYYSTNKIIIKSIKKVKKNKVKNCNFLFTLFRNKDFISQESPIWDENITFWLRYFPWNEHSYWPDRKKLIFTFITGGRESTTLTIIFTTQRTSVDLYIKLLLMFPLQLLRPRIPQRTYICLHTLFWFSLFTHQYL